MNTTYNIHLEYAAGEFTEAQAERILTAIELYGGSVGQSPTHQLTVRLFVPGTNVAQALQSAIAVASGAVASQFGSATPALEYIEAMTETEFNARQSFDDIPELCSVTEAAELLGISRQGLLKAIDANRWHSATKVGDIWVLARSEVLARRPRSTDEAVAAIARGSKRQGIPHGNNVG
jgi:hypothetical protein